MFGTQFYFASIVSLTLSTNWRGHNFSPCSEIVGIVTDFLRVRVVDLVHLKLANNSQRNHLEHASQYTWKTRK
jgi:hypothetical protein